MKTKITVLALMLASIQITYAQSFTEGTDLPGTGTGPAFTAAAPSITIAGTLTTPSDGQDRFQVIVPNNCQISGVTYSITDQFSISVNGFVQFGTGNQVSTPPLSGSFPTGPTPFPVGPGTYDCMMVANIASQDIWNMTFQTSCTVGVKEEIKIDKVSVYPNPTSGKVSVYLTEGNATSATIMNNLGQVMLNDKIQNSNQFDLDISSYPTGLYFLQVEVNGKILTKKIMKH